MTKEKIVNEKEQKLLRKVKRIMNVYNKETYIDEDLCFLTYEKLSKIYGDNFNENGVKTKNDNYTNELLEEIKENVEIIKKDYERATSKYFLYSYHGKKYSTEYEENAIELINEDKKDVLETIGNNIQKVIKDNSNLVNVSLLIKNLDISMKIENDNIFIVNNRNVLKIENIMKQKYEIRQFLIENCVDTLSAETYLQFTLENLQKDLEDDNGVL